MNTWVFIPAGRMHTIGLEQGHEAQRRGIRRRSPCAAFHQVEEGQGPRAELSQAAAEELRVAVDQVRLVMADTDLVPDDGITAGSRTTPYNVPDMRQAAATARQLLGQLGALLKSRIRWREAKLWWELCMSRCSSR